MAGESNDCRVAPAPHHTVNSGLPRAHGRHECSNGSPCLPRHVLIWRPALGRAALERDLLLVSDEMPRLGFLKPVMDAYNLAAGKGVHVWCFAQSISSLESTWGKEPARTLIDLAEAVQVPGFPRTDAKGAEEFAKAIGQRPLNRRRRACREPCRNSAR